MSDIQSDTRKILITLDFTPEHGGIQRYLHSIVMHRFTADDLVIAPEWPENRPAHPCPCRVIRIPFPRFIPERKLLLIPMFFVLLRYCLVSRRKRPLVFAGNIYAAALPRLCNLFLKINYHCFTYGTELVITKKTPAIRTAIWSHLLQHAQQVYYLTGVTRTLLTTYRTPATCTQMVPRIDLPVHTASSRTYDENSPVTILAVGRLVPHKGFSTLIKAMTLMKQPPARCTIAGNGPDYDLLMQLIDNCQLSNTVCIIKESHDDALQALYRGADIFVFPSIDTTKAVEGFGIVLLEAMAHHCAIIASDCAAAREVFESAVSAVHFFKAGDAVSLSDTISAVAENPALRRKMSSSAWQLLGERYVW